MFSRLFLAKYCQARRLIGLLVLVSVFASLFPLPLSLSSPVEKDLSTPFPCQNRPCGCKSAKQCWKSCCCFTNREKIAWAKANSVKAPAYVVQAAEKETAGKVCKAGSCCSHEEQKQPTTPELKEKHKRCCSSTTTTESKSEKNTSDQTSTGLVIGLYVQKCQGQGLFWNSLPLAILPRLQVDVLGFAPDTWSSLFSLKAPEQALEPPIPPPRLV